MARMDGIDKNSMDKLANKNKEREMSKVCLYIQNQGKLF